MKITAFILLAFCIHVSATTLAQNVTLSERKAPLEKVINEIKRQTGYSFFYNQEWLQAAQPVDVKLKNATLEQALKTAFANQPLDYAIVNKTIVLKLKETTKPVSTPPADPIKITGKVTDTTGTALNGATILVNDTYTVGLTSNTGEFTITANVGDKVTITFIGYRPYSFNIIAGKTDYPVTLHASATGLTEVMVNSGYQFIAKERATGSYDYIDNKSYNRQVSPDVLSRLNGIANSVYFTRPNEGESLGKLFVRGISTINASTQPLIVVDNFPYYASLDNLNPNDVESVTILKDAAAASVWGAKAGNGVIVITTKKGKYNQPFQVSLNSNITLQDKPNIYYDPSHMNSNDFINVEQFLYGKGFYNDDFTSYDHRVISPVVQLLADRDAGKISAALATAKIDSMRQIDNRSQLLKYFYRKALTQQYSLGVTGGAPNVNYYISAGYDKYLSPTIGNDYNRQTLHSVTTIKPLRRLDVQIGVDYTHFSNNQNSISNQSGFYAGGGKGQYYPYALLADPMGNSLALPKDYDNSYKATAGGGKLLDWSYRPLDEKANSSYNTQTNEIMLNSKFQYAITNDLNISVNYQFEKNNVQNRSISGPNSYFARNLINEFTQINGSTVAYPIPKGGVLNQFNINLTTNNFRPLLSFNKSWSNHSVSAIAGMDVNQTHSATTNNPTIYGYDDDILTFTNVNYDPSSYYDYIDFIGGGSIPTNAGFSETLNRFVSYFGNAAYTYKSKYTISGSIRKDQSNLFGANTNKRGVPLWSTGLKWKLSDEDFYKSDFIPDLALRLTYGYGGNVINSLTALSIITYSANAYYTGLNYANVTSPSNPNLRWEKVAQINAGIDFAFKNRLIVGSIEYYHKNATDLLANSPTDNVSGFAYYLQNTANLETKGLDVQFTVKWLNRAFNWSSQLGASYVKSKVKKYLLPNTAYVASSGRGILPIEGQDPFAIYSYRFAGLDPTSGDPQGYVNGVVSKDYTKITNPTSLNDLTIQGTGKAPFFGNLMNTFSWKQFTLSFNIVGRFGYNFRKSTINYNSLFDGWTPNSDFSKRWQKPGDENITTVPSMSYPGNNKRDLFYANSTATILRGDLLRLQDLSFSYDFNPIKMGNYTLKKLSLFFYGANLGILWKANKDGIDPEAITGYPIPKTFTIGVKTTF